MNYRAVTYFDASAAVKLVVTEHIGSDHVRAHFRSTPSSLHDECLEETPASPEIFMQAEDLARLHGLDLSDAFQIITVKHGKFKKWAEESKTVLATADGDLEKAAEKEGLRVWNVEKAPSPQDC
jgi:predicted nucleic acid-binding protein